MSNIGDHYGANIYSVKVTSTRNEYDTFSFERTPEENELENDYYGTYFTITVLSRGRECARLRGKLFDETLVYGSAQDLLSVADAYGKAESRLASCLNNSRELQVREGEWKEWDREHKRLLHRGYSGYIQVLFVDPSFRERGIASYLLANLHKLLQHTLGIGVRAVAISPAPLADANGELLEDAPVSTVTGTEAVDNTAAAESAATAGSAEKLREKNCRILSRCGYHEIMEESDAGMYTGNYDDFELKGTGCWVRVYPCV